MTDLTTLRIVSWNVNGIRAAMNKGLREFVQAEQPHVLCLQETKAQQDQVDVQWATDLGYKTVWNCAAKKGYSGTSVWSKLPISKHTCGIGIEEHDNEGRVQTVTFDDWILVNVYTPNAQRGLTRLEYRQQWDEDFLAYVRKLNRRKPVVFCGDLNCSHQEIDLANPKANRKNAGFTDVERAGLDAVAAAGFLDTLREFDQEPGRYTWWTYRNDARARNIGWRLDYFWIAKRLRPHLMDAKIHSDVFGSDHCPVEIQLQREVPLLQT